MNGVAVNPCDAQDERAAAGVSETAFVITCNDSVEAVVIGTEEQAEAIKDRLSKAYFERNRHSFEGRPYTKPEEAYRLRCYWSARETSVLRGDAQ